MKTTKVELLSPAKDCEIGKAAINHGADAVYIGGPDFGAREKASNTIQEIERLCRHAALYDAKVYVTLNTLLYDNELERARKMAYDCWNAGVDALIVQDMKLLELDLPPIPLHASTQCDNLTVEKVQLLEQLGFSQVVLGRELSLKEIRAIREKTTVPLEFFVHGALCVSHSGRCYLSQRIGNRSANRGACAQPCRLPWDLLDEDGNVLIRNRHLLSLKDLNNSAHLEELMDAGITSFKIEGRMKEADYVKNVTAYYRRKLDEIFACRPEYEQASRRDAKFCVSTTPFEVNPEKSFNRGFTDFFINGRQKGIGSPFTPKSMGEYIGEVAWCNPLRLEIDTEKALHNGDGLCFLNQENELVGLRADVVHVADCVSAVGNRSSNCGDAVADRVTVSTNRPHGAFRGAKIYRNYDLEWQKQVDASMGNRKIDIDLVLAETEDGYVFFANHGNPVSVICEKITANNPEKATENIRKKALQWGDTVFNPVNLELRFTEPRLIPASIIGEMKRELVTKLTEELIENHRNNRETRCTDVARNVSTKIDPDEISDTLMTCHHCIRYANGMCSKETGQKATPLYIRNGENTFRLEFDCKNCLMRILALH
ncbi:MAG: U32 family peptidase [Bacteroidales bacterium]|nr:U32 family peptidase [Bacteroidales bacterium]